MRKNQSPVHYTSVEETGRVRPVVDSGDGGVDIARDPVTDVEARPAGNYPAVDLSNSVHITLAHSAAAGSAPGTMAVTATPRALLGPAHQNVPYAPERHTKLEESRVSKPETWLLTLGVISATTFFTALYTIGNSQWVPSFVAQAVNISKQLSAGITRRSSTPVGGTASTDTVDRSAAQNYGSSRGAHGTLASGSDETKTRENSGLHNDDGKHTVRSNAGDSWSSGAEMPKAAAAKTAKSINGFMVPPPPPTPCVLPPEFGFSPVQPAQQDATPQQQLQQAQAQGSPKTDNQDAPGASPPEQPTADSDRNDATQSAALGGADKELQAALRASQRTVGEWTR